MAKGHKPCSLGSIVRETEAMKPTDKACPGQVSKSAGCNASEPGSSLVNLFYGGRAFEGWAKTVPLGGGVVKDTNGHHRGIKGDTLAKGDWETWETLPCQLSLFEGGFKTESYKGEPKRMRDREGVGAVHSSGDYRDSTTRYSEGTAVQPGPAEQRGASDCRKATNGHMKAQERQRRLYLKSKRERRCRYYSLYDKVYHEEILKEAWQRVKRNRGACGVDGQGIKEEEKGVEEFLEGIQRELKEKRYRPQPIRRVYIPKPNGGKRPLGIPIIRDRVVQMAVKIVIEPIFEADFYDSSYGFRPKRSAHQAIGVVGKQITYGKNKVVDIEIAKCFDSIPHDRIMKKIAERVADKSILKLIKMWLKAGVMEDGLIRPNEIGTPQGGVISPLLANIYLNQLDEIWKKERIEKKIGAVLVRYADDLIVISRHSEKWIYGWLKGKLEGELKLKINEGKSRIVDVEKEAVEFLGFEIRRVRSKRSGKKFAMVYPGKKAIGKLYEKTRGITNPRIPIRTEEMIRRLNRLLRGWVNYFRIGNSTRWFAKTRYYVSRKVRRFIRRKRQKEGYGWKNIKDEYLYGYLGLYNDYRVSWRRA